jgi:CelD/BcsL family acetyltransferase involved in cellulose biosynthesis
MTIASFSLIEDETALQEIKDDWIALCQNSASPFYTAYQYCFNTWQFIQKPLGRQLYCVVGRVDGQLIFVWPLIRYQHHKLWTVLRALTAHAAEFSDVAISHTVDQVCVIQQAWQYIRATSGADVLNLPFVINNTSLYKCLNPLKQVGADIDIVPYLRLEDNETWQAYSDSLGGNHRRSLARRRKVLTNGGHELQFVIAEQDNDIEQYIGWLIRAKRIWVHDKQKQDASLDTDDFRRFLIKMATADDTRYCVKIFALLLDHTPVSVKIIAVNSRQVNRVIAAYDLNYAKASPGMLLDEFIMKWIVEHGYNCNFGVGAEASKLVWSRDHIYIATSYQIPLTRWGRVAYTLWKYRNKIAGHKPVEIPAHVLDTTEGTGETSFK